MLVSDIEIILKNKKKRSANMVANAISDISYKSKQKKYQHDVIISHGDVITRST